MILNKMSSDYCWANRALDCYKNVALPQILLYLGPEQSKPSQEKISLKDLESKLANIAEGIAIELRSLSQSDPEAEVTKVLNELYLGFSDLKFWVKYSDWHSIKSSIDPLAVKISDFYLIDS